MTLASDVRLRDVAETDLQIFFDNQRDPVAARMAAFGTKDPDAAELAARWRRGLADGGGTQKTIVAGGQVVGFVATFTRETRPEVTYWIGRSHWGRGIASTALAELLAEVKTRPIYASAAEDNLASLRVLAKCGFIVYRSERAFANARGEDVTELFLELKS